MSATHALRPGEALPVRSTGSGGGVWHVYRAERRKLSTQLATRLLALVCVLGPFAFAGVLKIQSGSPADALFGVWVHQSGFALSLVVLGFCGSWGFPVLAGVLAGDIFASEDRYGTWKMVLTRSSTRRSLFAGKLLAAFTFSVGLLLLLMVSSLAAGLLLVGAGKLVSLGGTELSNGHALWLVVASWLLNILPMLAFTSIAVLLSVATRNGIMGVIGPALVALVMQLLLLVGTGVWVHMLLAASAFDGWYTLFVTHHYYGPLAVACIVSLIWIIGCVGGAWLILRRRDFAGTPVSRRPGWVVPTRVAFGSAIVVAFLAIASNWGPAGDTAARLKASIMPAFENLTLLQQRELGRYVPRGSKLNVITSCSRRAATPSGPGDWICTLDVFIPQLGAEPFQQTPVNYDVSLEWNGCYKAESPPSFVGQQTMQAAGGHQVVNPLFVIYGCFNPL
ncbi:MAG TPA: ABC transporter permease [Solirubrobacteraceae bacterium]|nr:ABC transporter permease [Solirubrobacteraceae bacterium]